MIDAALKIADVSKRFRETLAVDALSLEVSAGTVFGLLGPNGSGKTTTIRMVLDILAPDSGSVTVLGRRPADVVRERVGYLPEERGLYLKMRVLDHLVFLAELHGISRPEGVQRAAEALERFEAPDWGERKVQELSKGQQQTVQLIGALLHQPDLVILDEPFTGLDPVNADRLRRTIRHLRDDGCAVILSTHRLEQVEQLCEDISLIHKGRSILSGNLREIKRGYGGNVVEIAVYADETDTAARLEELQGATSVEVSERGYRVTLADGHDPQSLLAGAMQVGSVTRFQLAEPTLDEIFVKAVTEA